MGLFLAGVLLAKNCPVPAVIVLFLVGMIIGGVKKYCGNRALNGTGVVIRERKSAGQESAGQKIFDAWLACLGIPLFLVRSYRGTSVLKTEETTFGSGLFVQYKIVDACERALPWWEMLRKSGFSWLLLFLAFLIGRNLQAG